MRFKGLDFLRGIAILGVLFHHSSMKNAIVTAGGYGVDLFFVLSGFLVSGLLFSEYKKTGAARSGRFLIRRGFKIYPAFYFFLLILILTYSLAFKLHLKPSMILGEVFFIQNYGPSLQFHTWSLAVEEHFYIILSLLAFLAVRFGWLEKKATIISFLLLAIVSIFTFRTIHCIQIGKAGYSFFGTHLRSDGLFLGALTSYLWHFSPTFINTITSHRRVLYLAATLLVSTAFLFSPQSFFMQTIGFNLLHLGFAVFILLLATKNYESRIFRNIYYKRIAAIICFVGINSYSIYLWHIFVKQLTDKLMPETSIWNSVLFFSGAIAIGVLSTYFIEKKFLNMRERLFPKIV